MVYCVIQRKAGSTSLVQTLGLKPVVDYEHLDFNPRHVKYVERRRLLGEKIIILLRNPEDSFKAQDRHVKLPGETEELCKQSLEWYNTFQSWRIFKGRKNVLIVNFEDMIKDHKFILDFLGLPFVPLKKLRYSKK